jgi:hypothetical protein
LVIPEATVAESKLSIAQRNAITIAGTISAENLTLPIDEKSIGKKPAFISPYFEPIVSISVPAKLLRHTVSAVHKSIATSADGIFLLIFGIKITHASPSAPTPKVAISKLLIFSKYEIIFSIASVPVTFVNPQKSLI